MIWWLWISASLTSLGSLYYVLMHLAPEASQGFVQKIFFIHVPAAFTMYAFLFLAFGASIGYLIKKSRRADVVAKSAMIGAFVFALAVLISGPIWAKPIWGVYWTWDPRLITTFVVFVLIAAYLFVRKVFEDRRDFERASLIGAILSIVAVLDVPLIHFSVKLWRGIHPSVLRNPEGLPGSYQTALELMTLSFFLTGACLFYVTYKILIAEHERNSRHA